MYTATASHTFFFPKVKIFFSHTAAEVDMEHLVQK